MTVKNAFFALVRAVRQDGWENALTGLGTSRDKQTAHIFQASLKISDAELEMMYEGDDMTARIVDAPVNDGLRQGFGIKISSDEGEDHDPAARKQEEADVITKCDELGATEKVGDAAAWGRLYGGAAILVNADDGRPADEPLDLERIRSVDSLLVLDKRYLMAIEWDTDPQSVGFGLPLVYRVVDPSPHVPRAGRVQNIHASRLITFEGVRTSMYRRLQNNGWSSGVIQRVFDVLQQFHQSWQSTGHLLTDSSQGIWKMKGLHDLLASKMKDAVTERMQVMELGKSVVRGVMLDQEDDYERVNTTMTGYADVLDRFGKRLAAAAGMPLTVLMGESPAGLNATGESDQQLWDNQVKAFQTFVLKPRLARLMKIIMASKEGPTKGVIPDKWEPTFPALRQMTDAQTAELRNRVAQTDKLYIDAMVVTPEQVAIARFGKDEWSMELEVDAEALQEVVAADQERLVEEAKNPPPPPPVIVAPPAPGAPAAKPPVPAPTEG